MRVLIDTNIALTFLSGRDDRYSEEAAQVMLMCAQERIEGVLALHSLSTIWYVTRKLPDSLRRDWIRQLCAILTIAGADNAAVLRAVDNVAFGDFEDALQDCCAECSGVDYIVTANVRDYDGNSVVPAVTPDRFVRMMEQGL